MNNEIKNERKIKANLKRAGKAIAFVAATTVSFAGTYLAFKNVNDLHEEKQSVLDYFRENNPVYRESTIDEDSKNAEAFLNGEISFNEYDRLLHDLHSDKPTEEMMKTYASDEENAKIDEIDKELVLSSVGSGVGLFLTSGMTLAAAYTLTDYELKKDIDLDDEFFM